MTKLVVYRCPHGTHAIAVINEKAFRGEDIRTVIVETKPRCKAPECRYWKNWTVVVDMGSEYAIAFDDVESMAE